MLCHFSQAAEADRVTDKFMGAAEVDVERFDIIEMECSDEGKLVASRIEDKLLLDFSLEVCNECLQQVQPLISKRVEVERRFVGSGANDLTFEVLVPFLRSISADTGSRNVVSRRASYILTRF